MKKYVEHELIKEKTIERRLYQEVLVQRILDRGNSLVVAPTALGKTVIAVMLAAEILAKKKSKILFVAPTKPLAAQHEKSFEKFMKRGDGITLLTGTLQPKKRKEIWEKSGIICATPQAIENDIMNRRINLKEVSLLIFDEAHRAVGNYSYVFMAKRYMQENPSGLIVGLTASPGHDKEKIQDVCRNLFIKNLEIKNHDDADVKPYVNEIKIEWLKIDLPEEIIEVKKHIEAFLKEQLRVLTKTGYGSGLSLEKLSKKRLIELQIRIRRDLSSKAKQNPMIYVAASKAAAVMKVSHAHTLIETQGIFALKEYLERIETAANSKTATKADKFIISHAEIQEARILTEKLYKKGFNHPKITALKRILKAQFEKNPKSKVLVFNHYRDSIRNIEKLLKDSKVIKATRFIGQATKGSDKGLKQSEQIKLIEDFKKDKYNVLLCSSVAEEGIDIPAVDLVIFYEPIPSEIRTIQRRGRTGRFEKGRVIMLMAKGTKDEAFYWTASSKERKMKKMLYEMKGRENGDVVNEKNVLQKQQTLMSYSQSEEDKDKIIVYVDYREQKSTVSKELMDMGVEIVLKQMPVADYQLSDDIAIERKSVSDFLQSLIDGRLFQQSVMIRDNFKNPLIILEGNFEELYFGRNINKKAIIGALSSLLLNYNIPVYPTRDMKETAEVIFTIAKREQLGKTKDIKLRTGKKGVTMAEKQRFIVESLPNVGPKLAKNILKEFGNIKKLANTNEKELTKVEMMGKGKARAVWDVLNVEYDEEE